MCTTEIVRETAKLLNKKVWFTRIFNPIIYLTRGWISVMNKMFSDSYYELEMSQNLLRNNNINNIESIKKII